MKTTVKKTIFNNLDDHLDFFKLDNRYFKWPWIEEHWKCLFDNTNIHLYGLYSERDELIGFSLLLEESDILHLLKILIIPEYRKKSFGKLLLLESYSRLNIEKDLFLEVEVSNKAAINFYDKAGLKKLNISKNFYGSGLDAQRYCGVPKFL
tara:strand:- start:11993 stop:12445 length:453 start_codon:yes stop_codon:yes gene_type:complete